VSGVSVPRLLAGLALWAALLGVAAYGVLSPDGPAREPATRALRYLGESPREVVALFPPGSDVRVGDPVLHPHPDAFLVQIGRVVRVDQTEEGITATLLVHPEHGDLLRGGSQAALFDVPSGAAWIVRTLLPPERQREIREMAVAFLEEHGRSIWDDLWPEVRLGVEDVLAHLERELPAALAARAPRWQALLERHRDGVLRETLGPVLRDECLVVAREKLEPLVRVVGRELWDALPVWSLGWKYVWQRVPFTERGRMEARFQTYLQEDAGPILASHADEAGRILGEILEECWSRPGVREALAAVFRYVSHDPELAALARETLDDALLRNERLRDLLRERWENGLRDAVSAAARRFEPLVDRAFNSVVLDESRKGINPRLSRVVRSRVLMKDGRWVLLEEGDGPPLPDGGRIAGAIRE
jgi:hypothetical protein